MKRLRDLLRAGDPLRSEEPPDREERLRAARERIRATNEERLKRRVRDSSTSVDDAFAGFDWEPQRRHVVAGVAVVAALTLMRVGLWTSGVTHALAAVRFGIQLAEERAAPGLREAPVGTGPRLVYLHAPTVVSNDHIAGARVIDGSDASHFGVEVEFTAEGARRLLAATSNHIGRPVALLVDGLVVLAPTVRSAIGRRAVLSGHYTRAEAERIAAGMLPR